MTFVSPHISISAEKVFSLGTLNVSNSMLTSVAVSGLIILCAVLARLSLKNTKRPTGLQNVAEWIVESLNSLVESVTSNKQKTETFFPLIATFFIFILMNNWLGLIPGVGTIGFQHLEVQTPPTVTVPNPIQIAHAAGVTPELITSKENSKHQVFVPYFRAGTADLNMTIALGIISVIAVQYYGFKYLKLGYIKKYINVSSPLNFFIGILELISEISKIISFAFRLFGNVFAGEVLLAVVGSIVSLVAPMLFYGLEIFVGFIQALVFAMLSVVLFNMAATGHDEH